MASSPTATEAPAAGAPETASRSVARRAIWRSAKIILFLFVLFQFGLPAIGDARNSFDNLKNASPTLLALGLAFEMAALVAYSQLTRAALPRGSIGLPSLTRIQLATKAVTNVVPGGSAAGPALGYRLLTLRGVRGADSGFALATAGLGSAVVLNVILWCTMLVSIPLAGWSPVYVTTSLVGVLLLAAIGAIVFGLMKGQDQAERAVRWIAGKTRFVKADRVGELVRRLAKRLRDLTSDRDLLRQVVLWAILNWLLDAAALSTFLRAFGAEVRIDSLLVAFCIANIVAVIPITPGGLGVLDSTLAALLLSFGAPASGVALGVPAYRMAQYWFTIPLGFAAYLTLRVGPWRIDREHALGSLRQETGAVVESGEKVYDWIERYGNRQPPTGPVPVVRATPDRAPGDDGGRRGGSGASDEHAGPAGEIGADRDVDETGVAGEGGDGFPLSGADLDDEPSTGS